MNIKTADSRPDTLIESLVVVWEASVRATHDFLTEEDIVRIKPHVYQGLREVGSLLYAVDEAGRMGGFMGVQDTMIEMLFIAPDQRGNGLGRRFIERAVNALSATHVDVNEQNTQGVQFYEHIGFTVKGRSPVDAQGYPFPLLHMEMIL